MTARREDFTTQGNIESKRPDREYIARMTAEFMDRGGKIDRLKSFGEKSKIASTAQGGKNRIFS